MNAKKGESLDFPKQAGILLCLPKVQQQAELSIFLCFSCSLQPIHLRMKLEILYGAFSN